MDHRLSAVHQHKRKRQEYDELARITGRSVEELDADLTAPDPGLEERMFLVGDHVENVPATVDGIVYKVDGDTVWFCDEHVTYRMSANGIRLRYEDFRWSQEQAIRRANPGKRFEKE